MAHADRLEAALLATDGCPADVYVTYETCNSKGAKRLWVGCRDNRDNTEHAARLEAVREILRCAGFAVRLRRLDGRLSGIVVTDRG